jgi:TPR repeat protein/uncharacterized caspase-like protein
MVHRQLGSLFISPKRSRFEKRALAITAQVLTLTFGLISSSVGAQVQEQRGLSAADADVQTENSSGNYYALVIGIDKYSAPMPMLKTAASDAKAVASTLAERYGFNVISLLDQDATRAHILNALNQYRFSLNESDNLIIYFAGHGYSDKDAERAYWLPIDAESVMSANRISADDLTSVVRTLRARHVLIVSDSCYSGALTRDPDMPTRSDGQPAFLNRMLKGRSRTLMASGGDEPVSDDGTEGHSVFAYAVLTALKQDDQPMFTASDLFYGRVRQQVAGKSHQVPRYDYIRNSNHEDGDFVFVRKSAPATPMPIANAEQSGSLALRAAPPPNPTAVPDTVEAVSKADHVQALLNTCAAGDARGCADLGAVYLNGSNSQAPDAKKAEVYLREACETPGMARACSNLGRVYASAQGPGQDRVQAAGFYRKGCDGGDLQGCADLGEAYEKSEGVEGDTGHGETLLKGSCDGGYGPACTLLGESYTNGFESNKDANLMTRVAALFGKGCEGGDPLGCRYLGEAYNDGLVVDKNTVIEKNQTRAATFFQKACDGGNADACTSLGLLYASGEGVIGDEGKSAALYRKGCDGGFLLACDFLASNFEDGTGVARDLSQAIAFYRRACDGEDTEGCEKLGDAYNEGKGVAVDAKLAVDFYRKACSSDGYTGACTKLGLHYEKGNGVDKDPAKAADLYQKDCDEKGNASACTDLGGLYATGEGVKKDLVQAVTLFRKACEGNNLDGCIHLGLAYEHGAGIAKSGKLASDLYRKACDSRNGEGCTRLGDFYTRGTGIPQNVTLSTIFYKQGCDSSDSKGCMSLGKAYENGTGIPKDVDRATQAFEQACSLGDQEGCSAAKRLKP